MSDLKTVLINDSRIEDITGELGFAVLGGAQQNTFKSESANTSSNTNHSWQINVPSENIVVDRRVLIDCDVEFNITITNVPNGSYAFQWGLTDGFGPYPLNSCYLTQNAMINNCGLSVNTQDVMASLLRMNDQKIHTHYDGWTPSMVDDVYYNYSDGVNANNNPLGDITNNGLDNKMRARGAHKITSITCVRTTATVNPPANEYLSTANADSFAINLKVHLTEPLLFLSPFISNPCVSNEAGFLGINNFNFNFVLDNTLRRVFRTANAYTYTYAYGTSTSGSGFSNLQMFMNYLSVQPSQYPKISAKNVLPLLQYDRYIPNGNTTSSIASLGTGNIISSTIALNQIPDTILIFARKPISTQTSKDSDSFMVIKGISINFNNVAGILSSASQQQLWELSQKAGSSQSYQEFCGYTNKAINTNQTTIPTIGSLLVLQPAYSFNLPEYLSSSSLGSYSLQFNITLENQSSVAITPELVVLTITSGYITTHQGTTSSFTGVINKEMVMSAKEGSAVPRLSQSDYERLVGGVRENRGVANLMKHIRARRGMPSGGVMSGGVLSGGVPSGAGVGGRLNKYIR